ncbi:MAG: hypothetical protein BMS9Abin26_0594 [Gammaproteobacteria bacterium]|nr:MAG: hypothetical protein BMS9Abin26_0594 [Gammaproteobacteria bacterium]
MNKQLSQNDHIALAKAVITILDAWKIGPADQVSLLGLPEGTRPRALAKYRVATPLPDEPDIRLRIKYLLNIQTSLDTLFPHNTMMANYWVTTEIPYFNNQSPLQLMLNLGLDGIKTVSAHLDGSDY